MVESRNSQVRRAKIYNFHADAEALADQRALTAHQSTDLMRLRKPPAQAREIVQGVVVHDDIDTRSDARWEPKSMMMMMMMTMTSASDLDLI